MRYYLDTEFIEYPCSIELISIGIVDEQGQAFYAELSDYDATHASDWVKENVIAHLRLPGAERTRNSPKYRLQSLSR